MSDTPSQWAIQLAAQAWCEADTSGIEMNARLVFAFAAILDRECAEFRKDAERYRALRHWPYAQGRLVDHWPIWGPGTLYPDSANVVDAVVDSFMQGASMRIPWDKEGEKP